jgi:hypothetical protein
MDTTRVNICYRPLRLALAITSGDRDAFRRAARTAFTMWGGRFNPMVCIDKPDAEDLVRLFRCDAIASFTDAGAVNAFMAKFPHLESPLFPDKLFLGEGYDTKAHLLDMQNALVHWRDKPAWKSLCETGLRTVAWDDDDALADALLVQFGAYPAKAELGIDYSSMLSDMAAPHPVVQIAITSDAPLPIEVLDHPSIGYLCRADIRRHYSVRPGWDGPGFYAGEASDLDDIINFWNLRAADIPVSFLDVGLLGRYALVRPRMEENLRAGAQDPRRGRSAITVWAKRERLEAYAKLLFPDGGVSLCGLREGGWSGGVRPPTMIFGEANALGVLGESKGQPRVSFALADKPFSSNNWFHTQHLVASLSFIGGARGGSHIFRAPFIPELNETMAREMGVRYDGLRAEPERMGLVIGATDHDVAFSALPVERLTHEIFKLAGIDAQPSSAGLITRQLITRLGGPDGARSFKIPGVRRLLRTYGPRDPFTKKAALQLIGQVDPTNPTAKFSDHKRLYIEPREHRSELTPDMVFAHLVAKGLFQIGMTLKCPVCSLSNWVKLDALKQSVDCELCGAAFDATRQLVDGQLSYRRSGVMGLEKNTQGAVPVTLLLQQLSVNLNMMFQENVLLPSLDLKPMAGGESCETDFFIMSQGNDERRIDLAVGECKDRGGTIDQKDADHMRAIVEAMPKHRFDCFILFAKLAPFSDEEITLAKSLNTDYAERVILLTHDELEPYNLYDRHKDAKNGRIYASSLSDMAQATRELFFGED